MTKRIWELDALRGLCILCMVLVHLFYDLRVSGVIPPNDLLAFAQEWGGILFLLISGLSVTLGRRHVRRGLLVLGCGLVCTLVTAGMYFLGMSGKGIIIYFGVLHCLGICMILWSLFSRAPTWLLGILGSVLAILGLLVLPDMLADHPWLVPLGIRFPGFVSSDYFPLVPNLGYFLLGAALGRTLYRNKQTLLPRVNTRWAGIRFFCFCGRHSLEIYLLHQPILTGILAIPKLF